MKKAKVQRARCDDAMLEEWDPISHALWNMPGDTWLKQVDKRQRASGSDPEECDSDESLSHCWASEGHIATRMVMQGELPLMRKHMVECN